MLSTTCVPLSLLLPLVCTVLYCQIDLQKFSFKLQISFFCRVPLAPFSCRYSELLLLLTLVISPSSNLEYQGKVWPWTYHITFFKMPPKSPQVSRIKIKIQIFLIIPTFGRYLCFSLNENHMKCINQSQLKYKIDPRFWDRRVFNQTIQHLILRIMRNYITIIKLN